MTTPQAAQKTKKQVRATRRCRICREPVSKPHAETCRHFKPVSP